MHSWFGKRGKLVRGLIIALALLLILLEWATRLLAGVVHSLITLLGLTRFEMWMRSLPLWCVFPITVTVAAGYGLLEFTQFALLARRQYMLAGLAHILKWLIFPSWFWPSGSCLWLWFWLFFPLGGSGRWSGSQTGEVWLVWGVSGGCWSPNRKWFAGS